MKKKINELYFIIPIILVIFLIIISYIAYSIFGTGTLVFWIKNYNPPCASNNTSNYKGSAFVFNEVLIDNKNVSGGGAVGHN